MLAEDMDEVEWKLLIECLKITLVKLLGLELFC